MREDLESLKFDDNGDFNLEDLATFGTRPLIATLKSAADLANNKDNTDSAIADKKGDPKGPPLELPRFVYAKLMESSYLFKVNCSLPIKPKIKDEFKAFYQIYYSK